METGDKELQGGVSPRCWVEVRLDRLVRNIEIARRAAGVGVRLISVVKANGYGLGAIPLGRALVGAGVDFFAVANVTEAMELRTVAGNAPILLLSATMPSEDEAAVRGGFIPTISSEEEMDRFEVIAGKLRRTVPVHVKIDTGMGRLGTWHERGAKLLRRAAASNRLKLEGIYTHFASGAEEPEFTALQRRRLLEAVAEAGLSGVDVLLHADNSGGLESFPGAPFNAARVGLFQLGYPAVPETSRLPVEPVAALHSVVTLVKTLPKGTSISYCRTHVLNRDSMVAVIAAGYADGVPRSCGNRGFVLVRGRQCPILGYVTMDETIVDVTDIGGAEPGERATFFGEQVGGTIPLEEYSSWAGSIPWESLCRISPRVRRVYLDT